jgi:hypothetical protein
MLQTQSAVWGLYPSDATTALAEARENSLLYGEHTWGGTLWWIYGRYVLKFGEEWDQERADGKFRRVEVCASRVSSSLTIRLIRLDQGSIACDRFSSPVN